MKEDDVLIQVETDKVTIDVRYTESEPGTVKEILVAADDTVTVGQDVAVVEKGAVAEEKEVGLCSSSCATCCALCYTMLWLALV